jgi:hypothetical protein
MCHYPDICRLSFNSFPYQNGTSKQTALAHLIVHILHALQLDISRLRYSLPQIKEIPQLQKKLNVITPRYVALLLLNALRQSYALFSRFFVGLQLFS